MRKSWIVLSLIVPATVIISANNTGVATNQAKDRTGSPVGQSQQCNQCHSGGGFSVSIDLRMKDSFGTTITSYVPGETYTYEVELSSLGASSFGFQTVGLLGSTNANAGTLTALSSNTKVVNLNSRKYGEQTMKSSSGLFQMNWVAPSAGSGTVNFYAAGIGCNNSGNTSGDKAITAAPISLTENTFQSVNEIKSGIISIYPNPSGDFVKIEGAHNSTVKIYNLAGKLMIEMNNYSTEKIDVSAFAPGVYILQSINAEGQIITSRFVKK